MRGRDGDISPVLHVASSNPNPNPNPSPRPEIIMDRSGFIPSSPSPFASLAAAAATWGGSVTASRVTRRSEVVTRRCRLKTLTLGGLGLEGWGLGLGSDVGLEARS